MPTQSSKSNKPEPKNSSRGSAEEAEKKDETPINEVQESQDPKGQDPKDSGSTDDGGSTPKPSSGSAEGKFDHERLSRACAGAIGHPSFVISGALRGEKRDELTIDEARSVVDAWLKGDR